MHTPSADEPEREVREDHPAAVATVLQELRALLGHGWGELTIVVAHKTITCIHNHKTIKL